VSTLAYETLRFVHGDPATSRKVGRRLGFRRATSPGLKVSRNVPVRVAASAIQLFTIAVVGLVGDGNAQRRNDLPPPDSSRAPLLTRTTPDSIRLQVRQLAVTRLLGELQRGDAAVLDAGLREIDWGPEDRRAGDNPLCSSLGTAISTLAPQGPAIPSPTMKNSSVPIDFRGVVFGPGDTVRLRIWLHARRGREFVRAVLLVWDSVEAQWAYAEGLLASVCEAGTSRGPG